MTASRGTRPHADLVSPQRLREARGRFVSGVTVVTTAGGPDGQRVHGMTANAFTSVSLEPPLVLVSVSNRAHLHQRIRETGRYGVSVLSRQQERFARHFAGQLPRPDLVRFIWRDELPLIDQALVQLTCSVVGSHPAGDHTLHVGQVDTVSHRDGEPLVYHTGRLGGFEIAYPVTAGRVAVPRSSSLKGSPRNVS